MKPLAAILLVLTCFSTTLCVGQNYSVCQRIIDKGLREYDIHSSSEANLSTVFDNYCESDGSRKQSSAGGGIDLVIKAVPIGLKGNADSSEEQMRSFCKNYASTFQRSHAEYAYQERIANKAYDSFDQCVKLVSQGVSIEHNILNKDAIDVFFWAAVARPIEIRGVTTSSNVACSGQKPDGGLITYLPATRVRTQDSLGFTCKRTPAAQPDGSALFDEGTIQIVTNYGNYDVFIPRDVKLAENAASAIEKEIKSLRSSTQSSIDAVHKRIGGIKLEVGAQTTLAEFACGGEAKASDEFTFMVGSRDGTSCGVTNRNYVRHISLTIPQN